MSLPLMKCTGILNRLTSAWYTGCTVCNRQQEPAYVVCTNVHGAISNAY
jgi:hypothetical protein